MCGLAGSPDSERAFKLYKNNLERGYYSSGYLAVCIQDPYLQYIHRVEGLFKLPVSLNEPAYYFYHSRAPTVETNGFITSNNHPFEYGPWVIAHNGIISNFDVLCKEYFPNEDFEDRTDSCIIPRLLTVKPTIREALEPLKGTFALWMYNKNERKGYVARSANTLFAYADDGEFSSAQFGYMKSLDEGVIYELKDFKSLTKIDEFKFDSPYLVL